MKKLALFLCTIPAIVSSCGSVKAPETIADNPTVDGDAVIDSYVKDFNAVDEEIYVQEFPDSKAAQFMKDNIPVLDCPDAELQKTYYFRWWTYRKHVKSTPEGFIITEFLPEVSWAGKYNAICCPASHHFSEGRWLRSPRYLNDYARFWVSPSGSPRNYSFPAADAFLRYYKVHPDKSLLSSIYDGLKSNYAAWEENRDSTGLYWQMDGKDGMEVSISGALSSDCTGYRPTINSYMYGDAQALAQLADILGKSDDAAFYRAKADTIKGLIDNMLWDESARFYKVIPRHRDMSFSPAREELGYVPWVYDIPDADKTDAWLQLMDEKGFKAKYGPTTAEQRAEGFKIAYEGHECQWNGPSWPFATAQTLTGLANCLHRFGESSITKKDYFETLETYSNSMRREGEDGKTVCWIDENLNPYTGDWISRTLLLSRNYQYKERGKDYNHSSFCDLVISGLLGIMPQLDGSIVIEPLLPEGEWDYFSLSRLWCAGREITLIYDKTGKHYGKGSGFNIYVDGKLASHSKSYNVKVTV